MIDITGQKFGRLSVLNRKEIDRFRGALWTCLCDCGNKKIVRSDSLRRGNTKSCGCLVADRNRELNTLHPTERGWRHRLSYYKNSAKQKNQKWSLTEDKFIYLIFSACYYCGKIPANGIDRVNNAAGYTEDNSVPCCKNCNYAKNQMTQIEFFDWVSQAYNYSIGTGV